MHNFYIIYCMFYSFRSSDCNLGVLAFYACACMRKQKMLYTVQSGHALLPDKQRAVELLSS